MNKYELLETIGEGAYGIVIKARCKETGQLVAIKRFKESDEDELVRKTTLREVKTLRQLKDEMYVAKFLEAFRRKGRLYLVVEYVGKNLLELLEEHPNGVPEPQLRRMTFSMLLAVYACHSNGVIHRDIKPENLLVAKDGTLRLCDFGFARQYTPGAKDLTDYVATRWYRCPELLLGTTDYQFGADIFAAGCIMAELIDGQPLFPGESEIDQMNLISKMLGPFTAQQIEIFSRNPRFAGMQLPRGPPEQSLERRYGSKLGKTGLALLKSLLVVDPQSRSTVELALQHPYFDGLIAELCPHLAPILAATAPAPSPATTVDRTSDMRRQRSASKSQISVNDSEPTTMPAINSRPQSSTKTGAAVPPPQSLPTPQQTSQYRNIGASKPTSSNGMMNTSNFVGANQTTTTMPPRESRKPQPMDPRSQLPKPSGTRGDVLEGYDLQQQSTPSHPYPPAKNVPIASLHNGGYIGNLPRLSHGLPPSGNGPAPLAPFGVAGPNLFLSGSRGAATRSSGRY